MGGELEAGLFVGFAESKTIIEWILFFEINTKDKIIEQMKKDEREAVEYNEEEFNEEDYDPLVFFTDHYPESTQIQIDFENLIDTLRILNLMLVSIHNYNRTYFKIGKLITDEDNIDLEYQKMKSTYPEDNIKLFGGMTGDLKINFILN